MKTKFMIFLCKLITIAGKSIGKNASVFPGKIIYDRDSKILEKINYPKMVIGVTGSSGKGSTITIINHVLKQMGYKVGCNYNGSNGIYGITTAVLNNTSLFNKPKKDILLLELDERHIKLAFFKKTLTHLIITNITRDQPSRNGNPDLIYNEIMKCVSKNTTLIINADDPIVNQASFLHEGKTIKYGLSKTNDSYLKSNLHSQDAAYCPLCHTKLKYSYYHYGHIGKYKCPNKDFERGKVDYEGANVDFLNSLMTINSDEIYLNKPILYCCYYTLAAYSLLNTIGIQKEVIMDCLNKNHLEPKRAHVYTLDNRRLEMLESKNENCLSYYQSLKYISKDQNKKTIILGFDNVSRRYKFNDLSWLYDTEFELLNDKLVDKIICIGRFKYDVAVRLSYANIDSKKIILIDDMDNLINIIKTKTKGDIYTMVCFDMTAIIKEKLEGVIND